MAQKYFKANLPKLEKLRIARGWSREDLASEAIISTRTLDSIMAGKSAVLSTLSKLAKALETPVEAIVEGFQEPEMPKERCWKVTINISAPYDTYDETKDLPEFLTKLLSRIGGDQVLMPEVSAGSTLISFYLTKEQYDKFIAEYRALNLLDLDFLFIKPYDITDVPMPQEFERMMREIKNDTEDQGEAKTG